jgi:cell division protease FtsH
VIGDNLLRADEGTAKGIEQMRSRFGAMLAGALGVLALLAFFNLFAAPISPRPRPPLADYSRFIADVDEGKVESVTFSGARIAGKFKDGGWFESYLPHAQIVPALTDRLLAKGVTVAARPPLEEEVPSLLNALINWFPFLIFCSLFFFLLWFALAQPMLVLARQIEAYVKAMQQRPPPPS